MRPYSEKQVLQSKEKEEYNYRHSRARRVSENAFGISTNLFPIYSKPIDIRCQDTRNNLIVSTCLLHNIIRDENIDFFLNYQSEISPNNHDSSQPQVDLESELIQLEENDELSMQMHLAFETREKFSQYFQSEGALKWRD